MEFEIIKEKQFREKDKYIQQEDKQILISIFNMKAELNRIVDEGSGERVILSDRGVGSITVHNSSITHC
jgi:hypothetical protein